MNKPLLNYCLVTQNLASIIEDSTTDSDRFPDVSDISGEVIFTPNIANGKAYQLVDSQGKAYTVPVSRVRAKIINGEIKHENETGIYLFAAGVGSNPDKITYSVEYRNLRSGELSFSLSPLKFEAIPGGEVDLTMATPVIGATPAGTTKGDKGDKGDPFLYEDFTPEQIDDLKGPLTLADLTPERLETIKGPQGDRGPGIHSVSVDGSDLVFTVDENGIVEVSRVPLVEAANGIRYEISEDLTASKNAATVAEGYANQSASSASDSASSASDSAAYKDISLSAAERAEFAAEETIQQVEGDFATRNYVDALIEDIEPDKYATVIMSKNMYNPETDEVGYFVTHTGETTALADYRTSDFIKVVAGQTYTVNKARSYTFYDKNRTYIPDSYVNQPHGQATFTPPEGTAYVRFSYPTNFVSPSIVQFEKGATTTDYTPYARTLDPEIKVVSSGGAGGALTLTRTGDALVLESLLGGKTLTQEMNMRQGRNGLFNFTRTGYNGVDLTTSLDDVTPLRTQQGTVGANHGLALMAAFAEEKHDKTLADVGSKWTDGASEFTILYIDSTGKLFVGKAPTTVNGAAVASNSTPAGDLAHVSGAINTAPLLKANHVITSQMAPWIQRLRQVVEVDGKPLVSDGKEYGSNVVIRETYEIHDYGVVHDFVTKNPGQDFTKTHLKAAVGVENIWTFNGTGKAKLSTSVWEVSPTQLRACGFVQSATLTGDVTRYIPGVGTIAGMDFDKGADLSGITSNLYVTSSDLLDGKTPPTTLVDMRSDVALAVGLNPWEGASKSDVRLANTPNNLWDLRATKKIYPNVVGTLEPGWGRIVVEGVRTWLTTEEALAVTTDADPLSAWTTLDHLSS